MKNLPGNLFHFNNYLLQLNIFVTLKDRFPLKKNGFFIFLLFVVYQFKNSPEFSCHHLVINFKMWLKVHVMGDRKNINDFSNNKLGITLRQKDLN